MAVILNDRPDLAASLGCDGVHVGQDDAALAEARRIVGKDRMVGVTCHDSLHLAMEAAEGGADYVAFGAFFPTTTKDAPTRAEPDLLTGWQADMVIPCVAIGGITVADRPPDRRRRRRLPGGLRRRLEPRRGPGRGGEGLQRRDRAWRGATAATRFRAL